MHWSVDCEQCSICHIPLSWLNPMKRRSFSPVAVELLEAWPSRDMFMVVASVWPYSYRLQSSKDGSAKVWIETNTNIPAENWKRNGTEPRNWTLLSQIVSPFAQTRSTTVCHFPLALRNITEGEEFKCQTFTSLSRSDQNPIGDGKVKCAGSSIY